MAENPFDGTGFGQEEFSPKERSQHRHMFRTFSDNFIQLEPADLTTIKMATLVRRSAPILGIAFGIGVAAVQMGLVR